MCGAIEPGAAAGPTLRTLRLEAGGPDVELVQQPVARDGARARAREHCARVPLGERGGRTEARRAADVARERAEDRVALGVATRAPVAAVGLLERVLAYQGDGWCMHAGRARNVIRGQRSDAGRHEGEQRERERGGSPAAPAPRAGAPPQPPSRCRKGLHVRVVDLPTSPQSAGRPSALLWPAPIPVVRSEAPPLPFGPGFAGIANQSHTVESVEPVSKFAAQAPRTVSLCGLPSPVVPGSFEQSSGRKPGIDWPCCGGGAGSLV